MRCGLRCGPRDFTPPPLLLCVSEESSAARFCVGQRRENDDKASHTGEPFAKSVALFKGGGPGANHERPESHMETEGVGGTAPLENVLYKSVQDYAKMYGSANKGSPRRTSIENHTKNV